MSKTITVPRVALSKQVASTAKFTKLSDYAYFVAFREVKKFVSLTLVPNGKGWTWQAQESKRNGRELSDVDQFRNRAPQRALAKVVRSFRADL